MRLLKHRAEYELYADVILVRRNFDGEGEREDAPVFLFSFDQMTECLGSLHEFEHQRPDQQDSMGISLELPPTIEMVQQKRTATTTRSIRNRQRSIKQSDAGRKPAQ